MAGREQVINVQLGDPRLPFQFDIESLHSKTFHEMLSEKGFISRPLVNFFEGTKRSASMLSREPTSSDDKTTNIKELLSLAATTKSEVVFIGCDTWYLDFDGKIPPMDNRQYGMFTCVGMTRGADFYHQRTFPYTRSKSGEVYYLLSSELASDADVHEGPLLDLMKAVFEIEESPYSSASDHARALKELGHAVALWTNNSISQVEIHGFEGAVQRPV